MKILRNLLLGVLIGALAVHVLNLWYRTYVIGSYYATGDVFFVVVGACVPVVVIVATVRLLLAVSKI